MNEPIRRRLTSFYRKLDLRGADFHGRDLSGADFSEADLCLANFNGANLYRAILYGANLRGAYLSRADTHEPDIWPNLNEAIPRRMNLSGADILWTNLRGADLRKADLSGAILYGADLSGAELCEAILHGVNLREADLSWANLSGADLSNGNIVRTNFNNANLTGCRIYGVSSWDLKLQGTIQLNLIITPHGDPAITVDNLEVAQFVYLLLKNEKIRDVINTIGKKAVLILGRFTPERIIVLDAIRNELRRLNYVPIIFEFEKPTDRDFTETIMTLAGMCRFIIVDITNPKSSPLELQATVPNYMIPFVPIIQKGEQPFSMFKDLANKYEWILDTRQYESIDKLVLNLENAVIKPALKKQNELMMKKNQKMRIRDIKDCR